jgi:hypothetical protein
MDRMKLIHMVCILHNYSRRVQVETAPTMVNE